MSKLIIVICAAALFSVVSSADLCLNVANNLFISDNKTCSGYLWCYNNVGIAGNCPTPYWFNLADQNCDFPHVVNCTLDGTTTVAPTTVTTTTKAPTTVTTTTKAPVTTTTKAPTTVTTVKPTVTTPAPNYCLGVKDGLFISDNKSCAGYLWCTNGIGISGNCPSPFWFNVADQNCDFPHLVKCTLDAATTTTPIPTPGTPATTTTAKP